MIRPRTSAGAPSPDELVDYLLAETDQLEPGPVHVEPLLDLLSLSQLRIAFADTLPEALTISGEPVRALLDFGERLIAVDSTLGETRSRFSTLHEIGHYVLPEHLGQIIVCSDQDLGANAARIQEREANTFAAELQFKGRRFKLETASLPVTAATVKHTAEMFGASFESTARHLVEVSPRPCLLVVFQDKGLTEAGVRRSSVRYSVASPSFAQRYFAGVSNDNDEHVAQVWSPGRDIADSIVTSVVIPAGRNEQTRFKAEYFFNGYSAFCLLSPSERAARSATAGICVINRASVTSAVISLSMSPVVASRAR